MTDTVSSDSVAQDQLRAFIERIERMEEEKKAIADDIREIYAEAKGNGFSVPVLREIIKIRKQDHADRMEREALLDLYMAALGMQAAPREDDGFDPPPRGGRTEYHAEAAGLRTDTETQSHPVSLPETRETNRRSRDEDGQPIPEGVDTTDTLLRSGGAEAARQVHTLEVAGASPAPATSLPETTIQPTAARMDVQGKNHSTEGAGAVRADEVRINEFASNRGQPTDTGAKGAGTQALPVDTASPPIPRAERHNDDPRCLDKAKCGAMSNFAFCMKCRAAWREQHPVEGQAA